ncbi:N-acetyltransferase [Natronincola ferrireducens]|uniref:Transferase hexapeptide (Six repeat-containing protein) n=1 Tax=Natronincola ferrireducens TaxID=393762 RepID=A0A1G8X2K6_9FIRM|nr:N-acetyltransferase [Natronincola ferrireducens]SDJ84691.1 transferase hexapeptide (six repeat-containing protein) [Natronincola ferrireducens]
MEEKKITDISPRAQISTTAIIHQDVIIEEDVIIHDYVVIYPNTHIKKGAEIYDHCVLGKPPTSPGNVSRSLKKQYETLVIGENSILCPHVTIYTGTKIGDRVLLGDNCSIREECVIGNDCLISRNVSINYNTKVGDRTKIMDNTHITGDMIIEEDVFISVLVATTNDNTMGREAYSDQHVRGPHIKKNATIGAAANILPQIIVGENAVVGAGSVVTKNVPDNKVVMGVPAKVIRDI